MGRLIKTETAGKDRQRYSKEIVLCIRELFKQTDQNGETMDLAAYIVLALKDIYSSIDESVEAWEKRGYWVKADRFRLDWDWTGRSAAELERNLLSKDWSMVAVICTKIASHFQNVTVAENNRLGKPWIDAFARLKQ